jgi:hypothetical protein
MTDRKSRFPLDNELERTNLRRLRCRWGGKKEQRRLERFVLDYLALITSLAQPQRKEPKRGRRKLSEAVRSLNRRAAKVRNFARSLEKPLELLPFSRPPLRELFAYAEAIESQANRIKMPADPLAVSITWPLRRARKKPRPETEIIWHLMEFVRDWTGAKPWRELAVLLKRPLLDEGMNAERLRALEKAGRPKRRGILRRIAGPSYSEMFTSLGGFTSEEKAPLKRGPLVRTPDHP